MKVSTRTLQGQALDDAVAIALGWVRFPTDGVERGSVWYLEADKAPYGLSYSRDFWHPSTNWEQVGQLIEQFKPWLSPPVFDPGAEVPEEGWDAEIYYANGMESVQAIACPTPQIAVCRAIVLLKLGEEIEIPEELGTGSQPKES